MLNIDQYDPAMLMTLEQELAARHATLQASGLALDLTRGKPSSEQLDLADALDGVLQGNYRDASGTDLRNYGGLDGIAEAKALFALLLQVPAANVIVGGNSSLSMMYQALLYCMHFGLSGPASAWSKSGPVKFICPVPGYDRHFTACIHLGIELLSVPLTGKGPDMDAVEALIDADPAIRGIWCVPRFSNPTGEVYDAATVDRIAALGKHAHKDFRIFWDDAYAVHAFDAAAPTLPSLWSACEAAGTTDSVLLFGSTSKITHAGAGVAFMAASGSNLAAIREHLGFSSIGPDKVNQMRHVRLLRDAAGLRAHMDKHAALLAPRFAAVLKALEQGLAGAGMGEWLRPQGGYFVSFDARPGLAKEVVRLAAEAGVKLTPAGATFPYGRDPADRNIRIAPSFPSLQDIKAAMEVFVVCVKLASVRQKLG